ncbi:type VI secretion system tip protein VgrG [Aestuariicella hydrocarbonica]|uniref:Type VI secretion system tip protein VgrG n=1 Tax=Pseudomaricurvus hydrocarbonicus TaxID=1470433 RepID=A0A9E5JUA4_9GAMM|nr:type VI secretion system tip protein TssI/VgrG [Aestuariicella hydrocarbonica]NHO65611.1 type VI secretion system tip protein VgrG [Aestuariicella hydrocarbonica]
MPILSQDKRLVRIESVLGKDYFIATYLVGQEAISDLFHFDVELFSNDHRVDQKSIVGRPVTISLHHDSDAEASRYIHGYVNQFSLFDVDGSGLRCYRASVVPGLWFTNLSSNNRIFHKKDVKQIITEVLGEYSKVVRFKMDKLSSNSYAEREYCVQFDETDFEFISRLMAEEGISYYFQHSDDKHEMILAEDAQDYFDSTQRKIEYEGGGSLPEESTVSRWSRQFTYHTGGFEFKDYNEFTARKDNIQTVKTKNELNDVGSYKHRQYGRFLFKSIGEGHEHAFQTNLNQTVTKASIEHEEMSFDVAVGESQVTEFAVGGRFDFEHPLVSEKGKYLLTKVQITASDGNDRETIFKNSFSCIPAKVNPRPLPTGFSRRIDNPQLATIVEVKATESDSSKDPYTQVKVGFPWASIHNSCWVRVAQSFSGKDWGANFVPRIGQEVVINYINGNPDRPIVTGAVYNGQNKGPGYSATQSGWKTQCDDGQFNELRFDDKVKSEEIYMEAGKDHNFLIHNDQVGTIENDQTLEVVNNRTQTISNGNDKTTVKSGDQTVKVSSGKQTTDVQGSITITSKTSIELKVGGSSIKMSPSGITIKSTKIDCNASAMGTIKTGGILTLKGGLTKIN